MNRYFPLKETFALICCSACLLNASALPLPASWTGSLSPTNTNIVGTRRHGFSFYNRFGTGYIGNGQGNFMYDSASTYSVDGITDPVPLPSYFGSYHVGAFGNNIFSYATDVNDFGMVVGYGSLTIAASDEFHYTSHAFLFDALTGTFTDITTNAYQAWANCINNLGTIVGAVDPGTNTGPGEGYLAYRLTSDGTFTVLNGLGAGTIAKTINESGTLVGNQIGLYWAQPFVVQPGSTNMVVLTPPAGGNFNAAEAEDINDYGLIGGAAWNSAGASSGGGTTTWTPIYNPNAGFNFNNGDGSASDQVYAVIWNQDTNGNWVAYNLNNLNITTPANVEWANVLSINDQGVMTVLSRYTETDVPHFALYTIVPDTLGAQPDLFAYWQSTHFTATQITNITISGPLADPDLDGLVNIYEFFHGSDPLNPASKGGLTAGLRNQFGTNYLAVQFLESKSAPNVSYTFQVSTNLVNWMEVPAKIISRLDQGSNLLVTVSDTQPIGVAAPRRFLRLALTNH